MNFNIALIKGDGIGPEIVDQATLVLDRVGAVYGHEFNYTPVLAGGCAIDEFGIPLPDETVQICKESDSVILGAVGGPKWDTLPGHLRPERALLGIRAQLGLFANIRPARLYPQLKDACPLKNSDGLDLIVVRELTGGLYFGNRGQTQKDGVTTAFDTMIYSDVEIERIGRKAFEIAKTRQNKLCSVDKANVLESSRLWRQVMHRIKDDYPQVEYSDMLVDNCAMQLVRNPAQFDVIVTENMFGDILSDQASMITGSIGMLPSASLGQGKTGMYEPIHGSAPDIAGKGVANPLATILSVAMMLRLSFGLETEATAVENAVEQVLQAGLRTTDIAAGGDFIGTKEMGAAVAEKIM